MNSTLKKVQDTVLEQARDAYYAGLGVVATLEKETTDVYKKAEDRVSGVAKNVQTNYDDLAKKGKKFATRSEKAIKGEIKELEGELQETREDVIGFSDKMLDQIQETVGSVLNRLGVPTREEIRTLNTNVEKLSAKVDRLRKQIQN